MTKVPELFLRKSILNNGRWSRSAEFLDALKVCLVFHSAKCQHVLVLLILWRLVGDVLLLGPGELGGDQGVVEATQLHQFVVGPLLLHMSILSFGGNVEGFFSNTCTRMSPNVLSGYVSNPPNTKTIFFWFSWEVWQLFLEAPGVQIH